MKQTKQDTTIHRHNIVVAKKMKSPFMREVQKMLSVTRLPILKGIMKGIDTYDPAILMKERDVFKRFEPESKWQSIFLTDKGEAGNCISVGVPRGEEIRGLEQWIGVKLNRTVQGIMGGKKDYTEGKRNIDRTLAFVELPMKEAYRIAGGEMAHYTLDGIRAIPEKALREKNKAMILNISGKKQNKIGELKRILFKGSYITPNPEESGKRSYDDFFAIIQDGNYILVEISTTCKSIGKDWALRTGFDMAYLIGFRGFIISETSNPVLKNFAEKIVENIVYSKQTIGERKGIPVFTEEFRNGLLNGLRAEIAKIISREYEKMKGGMLPLPMLKIVAEELKKMGYDQTQIYYALPENVQKNVTSIMEYLKYEG